MQQTMLALGALLIVITLSLNQHKSVALLHQNVYLREMESAAADFAKKRLHQITAFDYDEARTGMTVLDTGTNDLTPAISFGVESGEIATDPGTFDDIDDFHAFSDTTSHVFNNEQFRLKTTYTLEYVEPDGDISPTPTLAKEFTVEVETLNGVGSAVARVRFQKMIVVSDYAS